MVSGREAGLGGAAGLWRSATTQPLPLADAWLLTFALQSVNVPVTGVLLGRDVMKRLVEFPLEHGGSVVVEIDGPPDGPVMRRLGKEHPSSAERTDKTFEQATASITPAARSLMTRLRSIEDPPDEIGINSGAQLSAQSGSFIAPAAAEANFTASMTWRRGAAHS